VLEKKGENESETSGEKTGDTVWHGDQEKVEGRIGVKQQILVPFNFGVCVCWESNPAKCSATELYPQSPLLFLGESMQV
jgi:hypothetical protein